jgi:hypothetical protein
MINIFNSPGKYNWLRTADTESACQLTPSIVAVKRADESADPVLVAESDADLTHEASIISKFPKKANNNILLVFMILILIEG